MPKNVRPTENFQITIGAEEILLNQRLSSNKGKQCYIMHKITVPGLDFKNDELQVLEERWICRDKGKSERFMADASYGDSSISMLSGSIYPDGNVWIHNTATKGAYNNKNILASVMAQFIKGLDDTNIIIPCVNTGVKNTDISDEKLLELNERLQSRGVNIFEDKNLFNDDKDSCFEKDKFKLLASFITKLDPDQYELRLSRGGSTLNLTPHIRVSEKLKEQCDRYTNPSPSIKELIAYQGLLLFNKGLSM